MLHMLVKVENEYHNTQELIECNSIEQARKQIENSLIVTAENLTENEIEDDWEQYYNTYEQAYNATFSDILKQLKSEIIYTKVN